MGNKCSSKIKVNTTKGSLKEYEIGTYCELKARSVTDDGLCIHHLVQDQIGEMYIPNYSPNTGICIALRAEDHQKIPALCSDEITTRYAGNHPRDILADNILRDDSANVIPVRVLLEALRLHVRHFPTIYERPGDAHAQVAVQLEPLIIFLENTEAEHKELETRGRRVLIKGNRISQLPKNVRKYIRHAGKSLAFKAAGDQNDVEDFISHSYVIHEEYDERLGRNTTCSIRIEFVREEICTKKRRKTVVTIKKRYYNLIVEWS